MLGRQVRQLLDQQLPAGNHGVTWNGTTAAGDPAASGVYLYRITAGEQSQSRKMLLMK